MGEDRSPLESDLTRLAAKRLGLTYIALDDVEITPGLLAQIPARVAHELGVFPCAFSETELHVVLANPFDTSALPRLSLILGKRLVGCTAPESDVSALIREHYGV